MTDYKNLVKAYRAYLIAFAAVALIVLLTFGLFRGYGGNAEVSKTIDAIRTTAQNNERRADTIIDAAKAKEEVAAREVAEKVRSVSDDDLPDLLADLLSEWRAEQAKRKR